MNLLKWCDKALARLEGWLLVVFLTAMVLFTFLQVVLRSLFTYGQAHWANALMGHIDWAEPLGRLLVLWVSLVGASLVTGENRHIKIDLMSDLLPPRLLPYRQLLLSTACAVITGFILKAAISYVRMEAAFGGELFAGLPNWAGQLILPIGFSVMFLRFVLKVVSETNTAFRGLKR
jgi:TRAP-type C4-dicarboxylate transport system permease small subunit